MEHCRKIDKVFRECREKRDMETSRLIAYSRKGRERKYSSVA